MKKGHLISRLTSLGLTTILLILTTFSIWTSIDTQRTAAHTTISVYLNDQYQQARFAIAAEQSLERQYRLQPGPVSYAAHTTAAAAFVTALNNIAAAGNDHDRAVVRYILAIHQIYLMNTHLLFKAVDTGDIAYVLYIDNNQIVPAFMAVQEQVNTEANSDHVKAVQSLADLAAREQMVLIATFVVFPVGLFLLALVLLVFFTSQRKADESINREITRLAHVALTDTLTNLGNHRAYQEILHRECDALGQGEETLALILLDVDDLKQVNEVSGHLQGDRVLTTLATILRQAHLSPYLYRLNGDEFAMILPQTTWQGATEAMERLRHDAQGGLDGTTISIGIAVSDAENRDLEILQEQAHLALSEARRRHNTLVTFEAIRDSVHLIAPAKVHALHRLLSDGQVQVAFQPIWDVQTNRPLSFEALARPAGDYGFSGPQELFDIAEKIGRAHELDYICVRSILARAAALPSDTLLFLNLTPQTLEHDVLTAATLLEAVLSAGLTPERVVLEITERSIVRLDRVVHEAKELRALGFKLALDDTGAGNAGLEMLSRLAVDFVKIDRAIVVKALTDTTARTILTGITEIARQMNSYVIAEGIEDIQMLDLVQQVGAQGIQGYLTGRPNQVLPSEQELQLLSPGAQRASLAREAATR